MVVHFEQWSHRVFELHSGQLLISPASMDLRHVLSNKSHVKRVDMVKLHREGLTSHFENLELLGYRDAIDYMFQMQPLSA